MNHVGLLAVVIMIIEEDYVTYETAKKLAEKGLNFQVDSDYEYVVKDCYSSSDYSPLYHEGDQVCNGEGFSADEVINCPSLSMAYKWLREVKKSTLIVNLYIENGNQIFYSYNILGIGDFGHYKKYEDALRAGIDKELERI